MDYWNGLKSNPLGQFTTHNMPFDPEFEGFIGHSEACSKPVNKGIQYVNLAASPTAPKMKKASIIVPVLPPTPRD